VTLAFSDNGVGIDLPRQGHKLFQPFSRLTTRGDGKGLGLYLIKNMVEKNGGKDPTRQYPRARHYRYVLPGGVRRHPQEMIDRF
jgi:nitrogen-specific signal transduction histidine kinase